MSINDVKSAIISAIRNVTARPDLGLQTTFNTDSEMAEEVYDEKEDE